MSFRDTHGLKTARRAQLRVENLEPRQMLAGDTFYVDGVNGDDVNNDGSMGNPFATIQAGADAASAGDTVMIHAGVYRETVSVATSGTAANPIVFQAVPGEEVVVSGADLVTGWTAAPSVGPNVWQATADWNAGGNRDGNTLFVDGELKFEARQGGANDPLDIDDWGTLEQGSLGDDDTSFRADDLIGFADDYWNGAKIKFHVNDFAFNVKTIADFNGGNGEITFDSAVGLVSQKQDNGYYIYDTINALDQAGEWFKAAGSDTLYYQAAPGENPNNMEVEFKRRGYAFDVEGRDYIHIKDITFRGASIDSNGNTDHNLYSGNRFYAYDKANVGRFFVEGDRNVFRDNEVSHVWGSFATVGGLRNQVVNNYFHSIGFNGTSRAISATGATELLVSHNTLEKYARSFMDGYPVRSEVAYNVFIDGGRLSWDTGVFDADGGGGDSSYSIFHHNVFRDNFNARGIFQAFYGRNNNAVIHHNLFHDFGNGSRTNLSVGGNEFQQAYHNTVITDLNSAPMGNLQARDSIGTRYNNNIQISTAEVDALGIDVRGNYNYSQSDFNDFGGDDYTLADGSGAIDIGVVLPGINDGFTGAAPDAGAFEKGQDAWVAGHDFTTPPNPSYNWVALPGTNLYDNVQFSQGIADWTTVFGTPTSLDRNSWNLASSGAALTGTFRTHSVEFDPGAAISRTFTGLTPNTTYTIGTAVRLANRLVDGNQFNASSGTVESGTHRGEGYVTGLSGSDWVRYDDVDFGDLGQYDRLDVLQILDPDNFAGSFEGAQIEVRLDSPTGTPFAVFSDLSNGVEPDRWRADRAAFADTQGLHDVYVSVTGANAANLAIGAFRLLKDSVPADDLLTINVSSNGAGTTTARLGAEDWLNGYQDVVFKTGPFTTQAEVEFRNSGRLNAYLDRLYLVEGFSTRGGDPRDLSSGGRAYKSISATESEFTSQLTDGSAATDVLGGNHEGSWVHVDLGATKSIYNIELTPPADEPARLSNIRVSVWSTDPLGGGTELWSQDFLTNGQSLSADDVLQIQPGMQGRDGVTELNAAQGQFMRVELLGDNNAGDQQLGIAEIKVIGFDLSNLATTDSVTSQSTTENGQSADLAVDNDPTTSSATEATDTNSWWQTRFSQPFSIGRIEIQNTDDASFSDLSSFKVSVWDEDPAAGGSKLWEKAYFATGSVGSGETFKIDGGEVSDTSTRRLASVHTGKLVRIELMGTNNNGNGRLALANVRVAAGDEAPSIANAAQRGIASQKNNFYGDTRIGISGFASDANNGAIFPLSSFTSARAEPSGTWWQVDLQEETQVEQIVVYNRTDAANRLNNFRVAVWDDDPDAGGTELWGQNYTYSSGSPTYSTGSTIGAGAALLIDGSDTSGGLRLDAVDGGRYVRITLNSNNILSLPEVQVWTPAESIDLDAAVTSLDLDPGTTTSPMEGGWLGVSPTVYGDVWWNGYVGAVDQPGVGANNINRDFVTSTEPATLNIRVPNGLYDVVLNMGDGLTMRDNMMVWAESQLISGDIDSPAGQYSYVDGSGASATPTTFQAAVRDGELNLRFDDAGDEVGAEPGWILNRISLDRVADAPPSADDSLQLLVDDRGSALLRNTTGQAISIVGYTIASDSNALHPSSWVGIGQQQYAGTQWTASSATAGVISESGAAITIPHEGQLYLGRVIDSALASSADFEYQLAGSGSAPGFSAVRSLGIPRLPGDFNADLSIDIVDYALWRDQLGSNPSPFESGDANGDGTVDASDQLFWQARFGDQISSVTLIDATTGNGSFEDWGAIGDTRVLVGNGTTTIPGWTADTTATGGWLRQGDSAATVGASSDGTAYAIAAGGASVTLTSDPFAGYSPTVGEDVIVTLDVGSKDGSNNSYTVSLLFGTEERVIASFADGPNAATEGLNSYEFSYSVTPADVGQTVALKIVGTTLTSFSQTFIDNITLSALGGSPAAALALGDSVSAASLAIAPVAEEATSSLLSMAAIVPEGGAVRVNAASETQPSTSDADAGVAAKALELLLIETGDARSDDIKAVFDQADDSAEDESLATAFADLGTNQL